MRYIKEFNEFNSVDYSNTEPTILVIDNTMPPEKKYLSNIVNYLEKSNMNYVVASNTDELSNYCKSHNIVGAISTGSDYRVNEDSNVLSYKALQDLDIPILAMCFGYQSMAKFYDVEVLSGPEIKGEFYLDNFDISHFLFENIDLNSTKVSFCFHDCPSEVPKGFTKIAELSGKIAGISNDHLKRYGLLFHPEDLTTTHIIIDNFINRLIY
jgi:anthranilate/para-aminobenzoate synthase component II